MRHTMTLALLALLCMGADGGCGEDWHDFWVVEEEDEPDEPKGMYEIDCGTMRCNGEDDHTNYVADDGYRIKSCIWHCQSGRYIDITFAKAPGGCWEQHDRYTSEGICG